MLKNRALNRKILGSATIFIISLVASWCIHYFSEQGEERLSDKQDFLTETLRKKEKKVRELTGKIFSAPGSGSGFNNIYDIFPSGLYEKDGISIFLYQNDSLSFWSDNQVPAEQTYNPSIFSQEFIHYNNGWFRVMHSENGNLKAVGLILIKSDFPYQNDYLVNDFQKDFKLPSYCVLDTIPHNVNINSSEGKFLFSISSDTSLVKPAEEHYMAFGLILVSFVAFLLLLFYVYHLFDFYDRYANLLFLAFCFDAVLARVVMMYFEIPGFLYHSELFSPYYFATSVISPSLGDLVVNSVLWMTLAWLFYDNFKLSLEKRGKLQGHLFSFLLLLVTAFLFFLLISTLRKMVVDSNVELNLNNIFNVDALSGLAFLAMTTLFMAFFFASARVVSLALSSGISKIVFILFAFITSLLALLLFVRDINGSQGWIYALFLFAFLLLLVYFNGKTFGFKSIPGALVFIIFFSLVATFVLDYYHDIKEKENRKLLAAELTSRRDPMMEFEFSKVKNLMQKDTLIQNMVKWKQENKEGDSKILTYINEKYVKEFSKNYELLITICNPAEVLNIQPGNYLSNCYEYFEGMINTPGTENVSEGFFFLDNNVDNGNYLAIMDFKGQSNNKAGGARIFIELFYRYSYETGLGYPDLLIDKKTGNLPGLAGYSYARYVDDKLAYKNGDFSYRLGFRAYKSNDSTDYFTESEGYNHYVVKLENSNKIVISRKDLSVLDLAAPFSYLFIVFSLFLLLFVAGLIITRGFHRVEFNFSNQLQVSVIAIIIVSFLVLGLITRSNIINLYNGKNRDNLSEKTFSILNELEHKIGNENVLTADMVGVISDYLNKFSMIFFTDINLFDPSGSLIASSRPQIFEEELLSVKMNTRAYYKLAYEQSLLYIQDEKIGRQEYLSAYIPFRNNDDKIIGYINLPYFAKQTELRKEIGDFLAAYINVYVLLIVLAIVITVLVSRFISRPLQIIREKLRDIGLGKPNEKIEWKRKDEIGSLVEEYNRMIDELAKSADMLARSERESAWREMARQVAHEIKNPLTPMKLSVQYLKKAWDEESPDWEKHLASFTNTIVEQIDSLSEIASAFSDFAKMPATNLERIELTAVIKSAAELYQHHDFIKIFIENNLGDSFVTADRKQLLRVFNNLVQNAVQAIGNKEDGRIRIELTRESDYYCVAISDNGSGITEEQAEKIFSPSFTTKSSGTGLGLAMVKSILANINGTVSFDSRPGEGATFTVKIPITD
jgi:signal transduction histidine kinase